MEFCLFEKTKNKIKTAPIVVIKMSITIPEYAGSGRIKALIPNTKKTLNLFDPIKFPNAISELQT